MEFDKPLEELLSERKAEIKAQIVTLRAELKKISTAQAALSGDEGQAPAAKEQSAKRKTIKEMVLDSLEGKSNGETADGLLSCIEDKFGTKIVRSSLSPQLTRLKAEGAIVNEKERWKLWEYASDDGAGTSNPTHQGGSKVADKDRQAGEAVANAATDTDKEEGVAHDIFG